MWQKAKSRGQVPKTDGKQRAQTNSTSHTRCLRQKESKTDPHDHTKNMACGRGQRREGKCKRQMANRGHKQTQQATPDVWDRKKVKPNT